MTSPPGDTALMARTNAGLKIKNPEVRSASSSTTWRLSTTTPTMWMSIFQGRRHPGCPETLRS